ncbi:hypothetical protein PDE_00350 [Penicillium oxalicum 114-2]|uniref:Uncharacterized protein n=1 Tax=Penicillium oxalicum (strain 114-2 / CGMCC 5302) TaxID=933388 RepID=S8AUA2_PENO1|nr:hypothetical protein PDE_00350 [Penicillium oxalicum 114-2]
MGALVPAPDDQDQVPTYEELYSRQPSNPSTGYSRVPITEQLDDLDIERTPHHHHHHRTNTGTTPPSTSTAIELDNNNDDNDDHTLDQSPPYATPLTPGDAHTHCAECDRQLERRERRRSCEKMCHYVTGTVIFSVFFLTILGIFVVMRH